MQRRRGPCAEPPAGCRGGSGWSRRARMVWAWSGVTPMSCVDEHAQSREKAAQSRLKGRCERTSSSCRSTLGCIERSRDGSVTSSSRKRAAYCDMPSSASSASIIAAWRVHRHTGAPPARAAPGSHSLPRNKFARPEVTAPDKAQDAIFRTSWGRLGDRHSH